ncbi:hypothetical protein JOC78_002253 [Bacillus ectoiniformans]|nr:hypothetical protein [Bacillus ectoiniformans]
MIIYKETLRRPESPQGIWVYLVGQGTCPCVPLNLYYLTATPLASVNND